PIYRDDWLYDKVGWEIAEAWRTGKDYFLQNEVLGGIDRINVGYYYTIGIIYSIFGHITFIARIVNCFFSGLTIIYVYLLAKTIFGSKIARLSALLVLCFPDFSVISALQWKDTILTFLGVFAIWNITLVKNKLSFFRTIFCIPIFVYAFSLRKQTGIFLGALASLYLLANIRRFRFKQFIIGFLFVIVIGIFFAKVQDFGFFGKDYFNIIGDRLVFFSERVESADASVSGGFFYKGLVKFLYGDLFTKMIFLPIGIIFILIYPLPLPHLLSYCQEIYLFGAWTWYFFIPFFIYGFFNSLKNTRTYIILLFVIYIIASFLLSGFNASGLVRYRLQMMPFALMLTALGMVNFRRWRSLYFKFMSLMFILFLLYIALKIAKGNVGGLVRNLFQ
ncbi:MAG: glycosyltransferase family 39 protein, partial [Candidatus Margulisbacteria bacterium]|nr:glycosyltransferase family 39 protein [Candidatus Margulisiibacteriota bacterium]